MKFKILSAFVLSAFILAGCGNNATSDTEITTETNVSKSESNQKGNDISIKEGVDLFNNSYEKFVNSESYTISSGTTMTLSTKDKEGTVEMIADAKIKTESNQNKVAELKTLFTMDDYKEENTVYFKDNYFYTENSKQKAKSEFDNILIEGNINVFKLTENVIAQNPTIRKVDGGQRLDLDLNVAVLQKETPTFIPRLTEYLRVSEYDFVMNRCQIIAIIDDNGYLSACTFVIKAKNTQYTGTNEKDFKSENLDLDIEVTVNISDFDNTDFEIPKDIDSYKEVTPTTSQENETIMQKKTQ